MVEIKQGIVEDPEAIVDDLDCCPEIGQIVDLVDCPILIGDG